MFYASVRGIFDLHVLACVYGPQRVIAGRNRPPPYKTSLNTHRPVPTPSRKTTPGLFFGPTLKYPLSRPRSEISPGLKFPGEMRYSRRDPCRSKTGPVKFFTILRDIRTQPPPQVPEMNARSIYRKLRRNPLTSLWGKRMYLTVVTGLDAIPEPMPPGPQGIGKPIGMGMYVREDYPNGPSEQITFHNPHGVRANVPAGAFRVVTDGGWVTSWWEVLRTPGGSKEQTPEAAFEGLLEEYLKLEDWHRKWEDGAAGPTTGVALVDRLHFARNFATSCNLRAHEGKLYWYFAVKASKHLRERRLRFAAAIRSAMREAKRAGVSFRVMTD